MRRWFLRSSAACLAAFLATQASAEVVNYYYVSGPPLVGASRLEYGTLRFDTDRLPQGQSLSNLTVRWEDEIGGDDRIYNPAWWGQAQGIESYAFTGPEERTWETQDYRFDRFGQLSDFHYTATGPGIVSSYSASLSGGDRRRSQGEGGDGEIIAALFLEDRGYKPGTQAYQGLFCGSWSPFYSGSCDTTLWEDEYRTAPGSGR